MTDEELIKYLGIENEPKALAAIGLLPPEKRAAYERMKEIETEIFQWCEGLGPKPKGVLIDTERSTKRRLGWK
jgi:hypothetical protein